jgi:hypothetical protein
MLKKVVAYLQNRIKHAIFKKEAGYVFRKTSSSYYFIQESQTAYRHSGDCTPCDMLFGFLFTGVTIQPLISHYYYTSVRDVFTGVMIGVSMFLITCQGCTVLVKG